MATKTYNELLDELEEYNTRTKLATETYEDSLGSLQEAVDVSTSAKDSAALSETNAHNSEVLAEDYKTQTKGFKDLTLLYKDSAEMSSDTATGKATDAAGSAQAADQSATDAAGSAQAADQSATDAAAEATKATNEATEATNQANIAEGFASDAAQSVTYAAAAATKATNQANTAEAEANRAEAAADEVAQDKLEVAQNTQTVLDKSQQVSDDADQVAQNKLEVENNTQSVANNTAQVAQDKQVVATNTQTILDNAQQVTLDASQVAQDKQVVEAARAEVESNTTIATNEAVEATNQANIAEGFANNAEGFATEATSQANIAEGFANNASDQVSLAEGEVVKATNQANIATNATNEATTQANIAEGFASDAAQSVTDAAAEVTKATNQANTAGIEADRAKTEADRASEVSGLDTVEQAVDVALGEFAGLMSESEARAINRTNEAKYDASGFVHYGQHYANGTSAGTAINEGMSTRWINADAANTLMLGRVDDINYLASKTPYAVTHVAGAISRLLTYGVQGATNAFTFELPEAEDGTRIYDSTGDARGSGKASLDLKVDVDPKYGDVPTGTEEEILREGVARAFEGVVKNGDFRLGDNGDWLNITSRGSLTISGGTATLTSIANESDNRIAGANSIEDNTDYILEFTLGTVTGGSSVNVQFSNTSATQVIVESNKTYSVTITSGVGSGGIWLYARKDAPTIPATFNFENISLRKVTEEVVTHPVDLVGLEYYEEELTGRQEVFECIQSLSTTFGTTSVPTVLSTRKLSYFQQYDGQFPEVTANPDYINDRYRCVVWDDLTEPQKREVAAYMGEKLFVGVNGHIVNGRLRARTIRGAGNGDWGVINSTTSHYLHYQGGDSAVAAQGKLDSVTPYGNWSSNGGIYFGFNYGGSALDGLQGKGHFTATWNGGGISTAAAYQGRCFFYVVASIPRLNTGFYHEGLNPYGSVADVNGKKWYETTFDFETTADCFDRSKISHD